MQQYRLSEQESKELAGQIAIAFHKVSPNTNYDTWIFDYMNTYNKVMNAISSYNQSVDEGTTS